MITKRIQVFLWRTREGVEHRWLVDGPDGALANVHLAEKIKLPLDLCMDAMLKNDWANQLTPAEVQGSDLGDPIIIVTTPKGFGDGNHIIIDGWHRIAKAVMVASPQLPAYLFDEAGSRQFKIQ